MCYEKSWGEGQTSLRRRFDLNLRVRQKVNTQENRPFGQQSASWSFAHVYEYSTHVHVECGVKSPLSRGLITSTTTLE
jgi:hypothetical protein